jgi:spermidine synthase
MMDATPSRKHYAAIFLISFCLLVLEISFARLLSVIMVSHYAFVAISMAMFGLGLSALVVYLRPDHFSLDRLDEHLNNYFSAFAVAAALCPFVFLQFRVAQELSLEGFFKLSFAYGLLAIPFFLGGICVAMLMTHFSSKIGRIYFADLAGASLGCLGVVFLMETVASTYISLVVATLVAIGTLGAAWRAPQPRLSAPLVACAVCVGLIVAAGTTDLYKIRYIKNWSIQYSSEYEGWNSFSRVGAFNTPKNAAQTVPLKHPNAWYTDKDYPATMMLDIDGAAWTPMMNFDGNIESIQFLRDSILYTAHHLKPDARVLLIGLGGGRDILAAKAFGQPYIKGIEINPLMLDVVNRQYGDYSGRPYTLPGVDVSIDEARSRLHRLDDIFDVIQLSLIDTLSLNSAGGVVFSENNLYTVEAFREYFEHLSDDGILSLHRYFVPAYPVEIQRLAILARRAWAEEGVGDFEKHIVVLRSFVNGTLLVKKSPFTPEDLAILDRLEADRVFQVLYRPGATDGPIAGVTEVITTPDLDRYVANHDFVIHAPTDDQPFFWNFLRSRLDSPPPLSKDPNGFMRMWDDALALMYMLIFVVTGFAVAFFIGPLLLTARRGIAGVQLRHTIVFMLYFACLGYGFLLIEIPLMQRFTLLLGKPIYSLAVVLFALLLFSGLGSLWSARFVDRNRQAVLGALVAILVLSVGYAAYLPQVIEAMLGAGIVARVATTIALLAPIGIPLGMTYPLGISVLREFSEDLVPWAWGMNGVMSVVASVMAAFLASRIGFTAAFLTGVGAYAMALACLGLVFMTRPKAAD